MRITGIELNTRCNFFCPHCYVPNRHHGSSFIPFNDYKKIIRSLLDDEVLGLFLTGGEPLTLQNFTDYYEYAVAQGFLVSIFTNGYIMSNKIKKSLLLFRPRKIELSLYGFSQETYMSITKLQDAYKNVMQNMSWLLDEGFSIKVKYILMNGNVPDVGSFVKYAEERRIDYSINPALFPVLRKSKPDLKFRIDPGSLKCLAEMYPTKVQIGDFGRDFSCDAGDLLYITSDMTLPGLLRTHLRASGRGGVGDQA